MSDLLRAFRADRNNGSTALQGESQERARRHSPSARRRRPSETSTSPTPQNDVPLPSNLIESWTPYKQIISNKIDHSTEIEDHLSARKAIAFFLQATRGDIVTFSLSKLTNSLFAFDIKREVELANLICSQWKQIIDGTKTDGIISLSALTIDDLKSLGILDASISSYTKATEAIAKFNYVKANHDRNTFSVDLKTLPNIALSDTANHYIYELITLGPIDAVLSSPRTTQDQVNEVIASLEAIVRESSGDREFLAVPAKLMLADAYSRSIITRAEALKIYNELITKDGIDPKLLVKVKLGKANILAASTKEEEIDEALNLFISVLIDGNSDSFGRESAAIGLAKLFLYSETDKAASMEFSKKIFDIITGNPNDASIEALLPARVTGDDRAAVAKALNAIGRSQSQYILAQAHYSLSDYNLMTRRPKEAGQEASRVTGDAASPAFLKALAYNNLGIVSVGNDDPELAIKYHKMSLEQNPDAPESSIYLARSLFLSQEDLDSVVAAYQKAAEKIWAKCPGTEGAMPDMRDIAEQALKGSGKDFEALSKSEEGRFLILICLESGSKELIVPDIFKAADYLEKARDLFNDWHLKGLNVPSDYMFEAQLHYDLENIYVSWPGCARNRDALKELDILEKLGQFNDYVNRQRTLLGSNIYGMMFGSAATSAFIRQNLENGQISLNINEDGIATDAFVFADDRKTAGVRLHLGLYTGGNWDASVDYSKTRGPVRTEIGLRASSSGQYGVHGLIEKRFDRFLTAGLEGTLSLGHYTEYELKAFLHYAKRIAKGTVFFANLEVAYGQTAQTAWKTFFETATPSRVPGWQWAIDNSVSYTRISTHMDVSGDPQFFWDKIYWRTQPLNDANGPICQWHVDSMLHTSTKPAQSIVIDDDPAAKPAKIQLMKIEKRTVGLANDIYFPDPNVSGVYGPIDTAIGARPADSAIDSIPFDRLLQAQVGSDGNALPTVPVLIYDEKIGKTEQVRSGDKITTTVTIQAKTETQDWHDSYQLIYEKTGTSLKIFKRDLTTGNTQETLIYDGRSVRDGSIAVQKYLRASISAGLERTYRDGIIGIGAYAGGTLFSGSSDATHSPDGNISNYGLDLYGMHILSPDIVLGWRAGWNKQGGFNCGIGPSISLGNDARLDFGVGRNGMFAGLGNKNGMIGFGSGGIGGTLNIARGLGVNFGNGGFGVNLGGIVDIGSHGVSFVNPFILLGTQVFNYFAEIKPLRGQRHKLDALAQKETDPIKKALFEYFTDEARIKEESSRASFGGDCTIFKFFGDNSDKAYKKINSEIADAIADVREKISKNLDASKSLAYLILHLVTADRRLAKANIDIAVLLSELCDKYAEAKENIITFWKNLPAEYKGKNKDADIMALIEAAKNPAPPKPAQVKQISQETTRVETPQATASSKSEVDRELVLLCRESRRLMTKEGVTENEIFANVTRLIELMNLTERDYLRGRVADILASIPDQFKANIQKRIGELNMNSSYRIVYYEHTSRESKTTRVSARMSSQEYLSLAFEGKLEETVKSRTEK